MTGTGLVLASANLWRIANQTLEVAYPFVEIEGELANFRVSKNKWVYFDIKDDTASVRCFGTVYSLPGPLEDGMMVRIAGSPRLYPLYNFSFNIQSIVPMGEGAIRKAADLLAAKLEDKGSLTRRGSDRYRIRHGVSHSSRRVIRPPMLTSPKSRLLAGVARLSCTTTSRYRANQRPRKSWRPSVRRTKQQRCLRC